LGAAQDEQPHILTEAQMREMERKNIQSALKKCADKIYGSQGAAHLLGLPPTTLIARIKKMEIKKDRS
jgi:transcriptional regulator with GAF, ATPase, and Fis domain